jgi:hypothetical protein
MKPAAIMATLRRPITARVQIRRSTAVMAVLFLGLGALWLGVKAPSASSSSTVSGLEKSLPLGGSITITRQAPATTIVPRTTTTTRPATTTTTPTLSSTTQPPTGNPTTTATIPSTIPGPPSTTTTVGGLSTTTPSTT